DVSAHEPDHRIVGGRQLRLVLVDRDAQRRVDEDRAEDRHHPAEMMDERDAREDERAAQDERPEHAPEEHAVLVLRRHREALEEEDEDEEVVDRKRLLQQVSGEELEARFAAVPVPEPGPEGDGQGDPEEAPADGLAESLSVSAARRDEQVECEQREHAQQEERPQLGGVDVARAAIEVLGHVRSLRPRGVAPLLRRMTSRTGTRNWNRSRSRLRRNRRYASSTACGRLHWTAMVIGRMPIWTA